MELFKFHNRVKNVHSDAINIDKTKQTQWRERFLASLTGIVKANASHAKHCA